MTARNLALSPDLPLPHRGRPHMSPELAELAQATALLVHPPRHGFQRPLLLILQESLLDLLAILWIGGH